MALYNESPDIGAVAGPSGGVVLIGDNTFLGISLVAHEVLHTLGEPHSRLASDTAPRKFFFPCQPQVLNLKRQKIDTLSERID